MKVFKIIRFCARRFKVLFACLFFLFVCFLSSQANDVNLAVASIVDPIETFLLISTAFASFHSYNRITSGIEDEKVFEIPHECPTRSTHCKYASSKKKNRVKVTNGTVVFVLFLYRHTCHY